MTLRVRSGHTRARLGVRLALAVVMTAMVLPLAAPTALAAADDNIPGLPIPASPFTGTLDYYSDYDDVFKVYMKAGQSLTVTFRGPATADFDLFMYWPWAQSLEDTARMGGGSWWNGSVERFTYIAQEDGYHYLDVYSSEGSGNYTLAWRVENEVPGLEAWPIEGLGRIETAIDAARTVFGSKDAGFGADTVILATARAFPDALGGGALAGMLYAPILLTEPNALPASVATEIVENLGASKVIVLGGTGAISQGVENTLRNLPGIVDVERIQGVNRYETAERVATRVLQERAALPTPPPQDLALVTTGEAFPDAVAASSFASWGGFPFYLVHPGTDPASFASTLTSAGIDSTIILGGEGAVSAEIEVAIEGAGIGVDRCAGADRYETAALIADTFAWNLESMQAEGNGDGVIALALTTGMDFPDALAGGAALGLWDTPILLTRPTTLDPWAALVIDHYGPDVQYLDFLGGLGSVNVATRTAARNAVRDSWTAGFSTLSVAPVTAYVPETRVSVEAAARRAPALPVDREAPAQPVR